MEIRENDKGLQIFGIQDAIKLVQYSGKMAKDLAELALHQSDLSSAESYLDAINLIPLEAREIREGLYLAAVIRFLKCFKKSQRRQKLDAIEILGSDQFGLEFFSTLEAVRDKHIAHDQNSLAQCFVGAAINDGQKPYKVEKVVPIVVNVQLLTEEDWRNLKLGIQKSLQYVKKKMDDLYVDITNDLEKEDYRSLAARPDVVLTPALTADIKKSRDQIHLDG